MIVAYSSIVAIWRKFYLVGFLTIELIGAKGH